jgi:ribosomal protein L23
LFEVLSQGLTTERAKNLLDTIRIYVMSVNPVVGEEKMSELVSEFWPVQPEPGSVADQLIKKGEARGEARGEVRGEARGKTSASIKTIRILQSILGVTESSDEELAGKDLADLEAKIETLRNQIGSRPSGE